MPPLAPFVSYQASAREVTFSRSIRPLPFGDGGAAIAVESPVSRSIAGLVDVTQLIRSDL